MKPIKRGLNVHFCDNLKRIRKEKGLSQQELADLSGMSKQHISRMESGHQDNPQIKSVVTIAAALGVSIEDLIFGDESEMSAGGIVDAINRLSNDDQKAIKEMIKAWVGYSLGREIK